VPHNDYNDPELHFPRLEVRVVKTDDDAFHFQVWKWLKAGERETRPLANAKLAGSFADIRVLVQELSEEHNIEVDPDDFEWPE
jgi:hypothetical protein